MHANALLLVVFAIVYLCELGSLTTAHAAERLLISFTVEFTLFLWATWLFRTASLQPIPYREAVSLAAANVVDAVVLSAFVLTNPFKFYRLRLHGILFFAGLACQGMFFGALQYFLLRNDVFRYTAILV